MAITVVEQNGATFNTLERKALSVPLTVVNSSNASLDLTYPLPADSLQPLQMIGFQGYSYIDPAVNKPSPFTTRYWYDGEFLLQDLGVYMTSPPFPSSSQGVLNVDYELYNGYIRILPNRRLTFIISFAPNSVLHDLDETYNMQVFFKNHIFLDDSISVSLSGNFGEGTLLVSKIDGASFTIVSHVLGVPRSGLNKIS